MSETLTVRLPEELAQWLEDKAQRTGVPKGRIIREELERARSSVEQPAFMGLAGKVQVSKDLSQKKGYQR